MSPWRHGHFVRFVVRFVARPKRVRNFDGLRRVVRRAVRHRQHRHQSLPVFRALGRERDDARSVPWGEHRGLASQKYGAVTSDN